MRVTYNLLCEREVLVSLRRLIEHSLFVVRKSLWLFAHLGERFSPIAVHIWRISLKSVICEIYYIFTPFLCSLSMQFFNYIGVESTHFMFFFVGVFSKWVMLWFKILGKKSSNKICIRYDTPCMRTCTELPVLIFYYAMYRMLQTLCNKMCKLVKRNIFK